MSLFFNTKKVISKPAPVEVATTTITTEEMQSPKVIIGSIEISVDLARTTAQINKGLSGRSTLASNAGMLFMFSKASIYRFWMPDMHFPLDFIWINNGRVVDITPNVPNDFDPMNPKYYRPKSPAQYVLEVNANFCKKNGIKIGDKVSFENISPKP